MKSKMLLVMAMLFMCIYGSDAVFAIPIPFIPTDYVKEFEKAAKKLDKDNYRSYLNEVAKIVNDFENEINKKRLNPLINDDEADAKEKANFKQGLNTPDKIRGLTPIFYAVYYNEYNLIEKMIRYGADLNIVGDSSKKTPLFWAIESDKPNLKVIKLLVDRGADVNYQVNNNNESSYTPLMAACQTHNKEIIKIILDKATTSIDVKSTYKNSNKDDVLMTPFGFLCSKNVYEYSDILMALLDKGVNVNQTRKIGNMERTPFQEICFDFDKRNIPLMQKMVEKGANVDSLFRVENETFSPLLWAIVNEDKDLVKLILDNGKNFDGKLELDFDGDTWSTTILGFLAFGYDKNSDFDIDNIIKRLMSEKRVDINTKIEVNNAEVLTPLFALCNNHDSRTNDCTEMIKFLLSNGANPNILLKYVGDDGNINDATVLHIVADNNQRDLYKLLKENGGDITLKDSYGHTPVDYLRSHIKNNADKFAFDYEETGKANESLIENVANINEKSTDGKTLLQISLFYKDAATAKKLIEKGAKWDSPDTAGKNAFDYAVENEIDNVLDYFIEKEINIGNSIFTVIDKVLENGNTNYLEKFLSNGDFSKVTTQFGIGKSKAHVGQIVYAALKNQDDKSLFQNRNRALDTLINAKEKVSMEGLDKKEISSDGKTPLVACLSTYKDETTAMTLLQAGAQISIVDNDGKNGIDYAFDENYSEVIRWMLENEIKIGTAIYSAIDNEIKGGDSHISEFIVRENNINENGFDKRIDDPNGSHYVSPMVYTVMSNPGTGKEKERIEIIKNLANLGFNVNKSMRGSIYNGNTALMMAVKNNQYEVAKCLIELGAKADSSNTSTIDSEFRGKTPLFFALKLSDKGEMAKLILKAMEYQVKDVVLNSDDEKGVSLLMYLASYADFDVINGILPSFIEQNHNALERTDAKGRTPFLHAVMNNKEEKVMRLFRMYGANIETTDNEGNNAQILAEYNDRKEIIKSKLEDWGVY